MKVLLWFDNNINKCLASEKQYFCEVLDSYFMEVGADN